MLRTAINRARNLLLYGHYVPNDYYVLDDKGVIYISIPKVACTAIKSALFPDLQDGENSASEMDIHSKAKRYGVNRLTSSQCKYFKFAFVRNPFDRLVSCYEDKVRKPSQHIGRYYFSTRYNNLLLQSLYGSHFSPEMSFAQFLELVHRIPDRFADAHFRSQVSMLYEKGTCVADYIGKFEDLESDWSTLASRFGFPTLRRRNLTQRLHWSRYYDSARLVALVTERFGDDIDRFGYRPACEAALGAALPPATV
jgi:chondroitin 4-sulfotransferase 11